MSLFTIIKKVENIILGNKINDLKPKNYWKKYRKSKI